MGRRRAGQVTMLVIGVVLIGLLYLAWKLSASSVNEAAGYVRPRGKLRESSKHEEWRQLRTTDDVRDDVKEEDDDDGSRIQRRLEYEYKQRVESDMVLPNDDTASSVRRGPAAGRRSRDRTFGVGVDKTVVGSERPAISKRPALISEFQLRAVDPSRKTADSFNKMIESANKRPLQQQRAGPSVKEAKSSRINRTGSATLVDISTSTDDIANLTESKKTLPPSKSSSSSILSESRGLLGPLRGGPARCSLYDVRKDYPRSDPDAADVKLSDCVRLEPGVGQRRVRRRSTAVKSSDRPDDVVVCIFSNEDDTHLSKPLRVHKIWEPHIVKLFMSALDYLDARGQGRGKFKDHALPDGARTVGVYDLGANVGQYSLLAAGLLSKRVVAVEPYRPNIYRLHQAVILNGLTEKVLVVENAVSDVRETFELSTVKGNPSGVALTSQDADKYCTDPTCPPHATTIYMDDLLEVTNFDVAVMKIDIEGYEHRAFVHSAQLLTDVYVPYIFMEWTRMREYHGSEKDSSEDKRLVQSMVDRLTGDLGYKAYGANDLRELNNRQWYSWPHDVVWVHSQVVPPSELLSETA